MLNKIFDEFNSLYGLETKPLNSDLNGMVEIVGSEFAELKEEMPTLRTSDERWVPNPNNFTKEGIDLIYATAQQLRERGVDLDAALREVHRSNMSKALDLYDPELADSELQEAKKRYPNAELVPHEGYYVIKCKDSGKVVRPTTYSPAKITNEMIGSN